MIVLLLHAFFSTSFAFIFSAMFGHLGPVIAVVSLLLGTWFAKRGARQIRAIDPGLRLLASEDGEAGIINMLLMILIVYAGARHFAWMLFSADGKLWTLHPNNFGDLPLHINYIREIASGLSFPPVNPSFASETLRYPFGPDLYSALWETLGLPISANLFVVGFSATLVTLTLLRWFGGWWTVGAFFFSGGLVGWTIFQGPLPGWDLTQGFDWKNLFLSVFITQRGVLFALPAGLLLIEMTRRHFAGEIKLTARAATTLGWLWGFLPLFHVHAFAVVSLLMGGMAIVETRSINGLVSLLKSRMAMIAYLPAILFVLRSSDTFKKVSVLRLDPWWTTDFVSAPGFLLRNFGPWLFLPFVVAIAIGFSKRLSSERRRALWGEWLLYAVIFAFFFNVMLAPWSWDNIKILIFPYLGFARLAWLALDPVLPKYSRFAFAGVLFFSGFLAVNLSLVPPKERALTVYEWSALGAVEGALDEIPQAAIFAAAPTHNHPLTYFGRLRAVGYEGHLWSHGINYQSKMAQLNALMRGQGDALALAHELGVTHVMWSPSEAAFFQKEPVWPTGFKNVSRVSGVSIYEVPK